MKKILTPKKERLEIRITPLIRGRLEKLAIDRETTISQVIRDLVLEKLPL